MLTLVCSRLLLLASVVLPQPPTLGLDHTCWEDAEDHLANARADRDQGDTASALLEYREALLHEPESLEAVRGLADVAASAGRKDLGDAALSMWMQLDPADAEPALRLARLRLDTGEDEAALRLAVEAARRNPSSGDARFLQGRVFFQAGDMAAAVIVLEKAVSLDPQHGHAFDLLGLSYLRLGRPAEAVASLKVAVLLLPEVRGVHENLVRATQALARPREARLSPAVPAR